MTKNKYMPLVFDKVIREFEKHNGRMTIDEFKQAVYNFRYTEEEIINEIYNIKLDLDLIRSIYYMTRLSKKDVKDIIRWLNDNNYITIDRSSKKDVFVLKD